MRSGAKAASAAAAPAADQGGLDGVAFDGASARGNGAGKVFGDPERLTREYGGITLSSCKQ